MWREPAPQAITVAASASSRRLSELCRGVGFQRQRSHGAAATTRHRLKQGRRVAITATTHHSAMSLPFRRSLGAGVGRRLGVGCDLGVGIGLGVGVGVGVRVAVGVGLAVGVAVGVAVAVAVAVAVGVGVESSRTRWPGVLQLITDHFSLITWESGSRCRSGPRSRRRL
jgi:hypothetical protein